MMPFGCSEVSSGARVVTAAGVAVVVALVLFLSRTSEDQIIAFDGESEPPEFPVQAMGTQLDSEQPGDSELKVIELLIRGLPIEGCEPRSPWEREPSNDEEWRTLLDSAGEKLALTGDPDLLLGAALLDADEASRWELVSRALKALPGNQVALWHQLHHCYQVGCDRDAIETAAIAADESNGMVWLEIASDRIRRGAWPEAESALRRAISSTGFDAYFIEHAMIVERGLAATTDLDYTNRIMAGIGVSAALAIPAFGDVSLACRSGENDGLIWIDLCEELGVKMAGDSRELISVLVGYGYRRAAALRAGDPVKADQLEQESSRIQSDLLKAQARSGAQALLENDPAVMQRYVEYFRAHGELQAVDLLIEDARRLRADPTYDQCNFVGNPDYGL